MEEKNIDNIIIVDSVEGNTIEGIARLEEDNIANIIIIYSGDRDLAREFRKSRLGVSASDDKSKDKGRVE